MSYRGRSHSDSESDSGMLKHDLLSDLRSRPAVPERQALEAPTLYFGRFLPYIRFSALDNSTAALELPTPSKAHHIIRINRRSDPAEPLNIPTVHVL